KSGDSVANGRGVLGTFEAARPLAPLVCLGGDPLHRSFRSDLRFRRRAAIERQPGQVARAETVAMAKTLELKLKEGDQAPEFTAPTNGGGTISLSEFGGKN